MTNENKTVRVAIISFAHGHAYGYAGCLQGIPQAELVVIQDDNAERGQAAADQFGVSFEPSLDAVLSRDDIDAVVICSENIHHARLTIAAAVAGKHVLCEKPLATTVEDAEAMIAACKKAGVQLQTAFPVRFNASTVALRDAVQAGQIGRPLAITARNPGTCPMDWFVQPELSGGGAVIDHTVHVADVLRWMLDAEFTEVYAEADTRIYDIPGDDTGLLMLKMSNGIPVSLDTSWSRPKNWPTWGGVQIDVIGETGVLSLDAYINSVELAEVNGPSYSWPNVEFSGDPEMVQSFIEAVRDGTSVQVNGEDGMAAMKVALAAYESVRTKQVVSIA